jgi:hypothetical protein
MPTLMLEEKKNYEVDIWGKHVETPHAFLYQILKKLRNGYSPIVGICGCQQNGKSFVAVWLTKFIYDLQDKPYDPTQITFYEPDRAMMDLENKNKDALLIDEAGDVMDYQEWHKQTHRALRSMINTQAYKNNLYVFISPFLAQIDKSLRVHCDFAIKVLSRGRFKVWKYVKKYDAEKMEQATYKVFLDDVDIRMKHVPKPIWERYKKHSIEEKEKIRVRRLDREAEKNKQAFDIHEAIELSEKLRNLENNEVKPWQI